MRHFGDGLNIKGFQVLRCALGGWRCALSNTQPLQSSRKLCGGEIDLQHPTVQWSGGRFRGMKNECCVHPDIARLGEAGDDTAARDGVADGVFRNAPELMGPRRDQERCVRVRHRIDVDP